MFSYYKLLPKHAESFVLLEAELTRKGTWFNFIRCW